MPNLGMKGPEPFQQGAAPQGRHSMYSNHVAKHNTAFSGAEPFLYARTVALHGAKPPLWRGQAQERQE